MGLCGIKSLWQSLAQSYGFYVSLSEDIMMRDLKVGQGVDNRHPHKEAPEGRGWSMDGRTLPQPKEGPRGPR